MSRLIDAHKLQKAIYEYKTVRSITKDKVVEMIKEQPTIDPVKHGYWVEREEWFDGESKPRMAFGCSECGHSMYSKHDTLNFCPRCGSQNRCEASD